MDVHSPVIAKRLWNVLRITFFMIRKSLVSKRKLIMEMNMMMKKGKFLRKFLRNLMSYHHHSRKLARGGYGIQEYEFPCSESPIPVFSHVPKRKHHFIFPCINSPEVIEEINELAALEIQEEEPKVVVLVPKTPEYLFNFRFDRASVFVRVSNYSSEDENVEGGINGQVDDQAEAFIRRFYEQLRMQTRMQLLQHQEM